MSGLVLLLKIAFVAYVVKIGENMAVGRVITVFEVKCRSSPGFIYQKVGETYMCLYWSTTGNNFSNAQLDCGGKGARLAVVNTPEKRNLLAGKSDTWIGLDDRQIEGRYMWHDGTELTDNQRTDFFCYGQPDNWNDAEDCLHASIYCSAPHNINDGNCETINKYLCEKVK
uniref:C-type lectin domain-containing protein n=1 Tax=Biomphalaria glabrata TaxID=6526 RepID=A0A2C9KYC8_BIOGL